MISRRRLIETVAVSASAALFLWMYLASAPLAGSVRDGASGSSTPALEQDAETFAYEWRHGQAGWPIYVPGFFLAAFASAPLVTRPFREVAATLAASLILGWLVAWLFANPGARLVAEDFASRHDVALAGGPSTLAPWRAFPAALTLTAWCLLVVGYGRAVRTREFRWLGLAAALYVAVAAIRGTFAFGELSGVWFARAFAGDLVAICSAAAAVFAALVLTVAFRRTRFGPQPSSWASPMRSPSGPRM